MAVPNGEGAFDPAVMTADLAIVRQIVRAWYGQVKESDWKRPTESRPTGWTLKQAFCHIVAVAEFFNEALEIVLDSENPKVLPIKSRQELAEFNQAQIEQRQDFPPEYLLQSFLESLAKTTDIIEGLSPSEFDISVPLNAYNRPLTVAELIGNQLSHPVLVHGAQLANGIGVEPIWQHFSADLMHRQLTRFFHILSYSYWPERGQGLKGVINFKVRGEGGGHWHVGLDNDGGYAGRGLGERPMLTLYFSSPDVCCSVFTVQLGPIRGLFTGKVFAWGNIPLAFKLPRLFTPT